MQPLIEPLYGAKSLVEVLALAATGESRDGRDLVRETWSGILGLPLEEDSEESTTTASETEAEAEAAAEGDGEEAEAAEEAVPVDPMSLPFPVALSEFEVAWRKVLHDGLLDGSAAAAADLPAIAPEDGAAAVRAAGDAAPPIAAGDDLEIVFRCSPAVHDGRFANNGWLQEVAGRDDQADLGQRRPDQPRHRRRAGSRERGPRHGGLRRPGTRASCLARCRDRRTTR